MCLIGLLSIICARRTDSFKRGENVVKVKVEYSLKKKAPYSIPFTIPSGRKSFRHCQRTEFYSSICNMGNEFILINISSYCVLLLIMAGKHILLHTHIMP